jgi:hypothetical protein
MTYVIFHRKLNRNSHINRASRCVAKADALKTGFYNTVKEYLKILSNTDA